MYSENDYKELSLEYVEEVMIGRTNGICMYQKDILELLWKAYKEGYQARIDDLGSE